MMTHLDYSDDQFESEFDNCSFDPSLFTHEAHLRLAYIHIKKYGQEAAIENICNQIKAFDAHFGDGTKFHKTISVAAVKIMNHFMNKQRGLGFEKLIKSYPRLITSFKDLINQHYSQNILNNPKAKGSFLLPDLQEF